MSSAFFDVQDVVVSNPRKGNGSGELCLVPSLLYTTVCHNTDAQHQFLDEEIILSTHTQRPKEEYSEFVSSLATHFVQEVRVADEQPQVNVYWADEPGLELELAELDCLHRTRSLKCSLNACS